MKYKKSIFQKYLKSKKNPYLYDIFKESRLYASNYTELNDLEEGYFYYGVNEKKRYERYRIRIFPKVRM